jgi:hypothetical protein
MRAAPATPRAVETGARHRNPRGLRGVSHVSRVAAGDSSAGTAAASRVAMSHDARVATAPRVFVMSDIHTDFPENMSWCASLSDVAFARDAVILGGDVSDDLRVLETTLRLFKRKFRHVFFTPGNHDLWIKGKGKEKSEEQRGDETTTFRDSLAKLEAVLSLCETCGVRTKPFLLLPSDGDDDGDDGDIDNIDNIDVTETETETGTGGVWIVPVLAWHHASFDHEPDIPPSVKVVPPPERVMSDFRLCVWPSPLDPGDASVALASGRDERHAPRVGRLLAQAAARHFGRTRIAHPLVLALPAETRAVPGEADALLPEPPESRRVGFHPAPHRDAADARLGRIRIGRGGG